MHGRRRVASRRGSTFLLRARQRRRHARPRRIRHAGTDPWIESSRPSRATKATSIGNCMKNVWMLLQGARMIAVSVSSALRPSSPLRRLAESNADSMREARRLPVPRVRRTSTALVGSSGSDRGMSRAIRKLARRRPLRVARWSSRTGRTRAVRTAGVPIPARRRPRRAASGTRESPRCSRARPGSS